MSNLRPDKAAVVEEAFSGTFQHYPETDTGGAEDSGKVESARLTWTPQNDSKIIFIFGRLLDF